jgi:hypothetical protein
MIRKGEEIKIGLEEVVKEKKRIRKRNKNRTHGASGEKGNPPTRHSCLGAIEEKEHDSLYFHRCQGFQ